MLNQSLGRRYKVIQTLGQGGLAQTYIAEDLHRPSHPQCVVKLLKSASKDSRFLLTARRLFHKEAEILEKLGEHGQIPRLLAHFEENQEFYIVQEFIDGHTLGTELPPGHYWSEGKVISMLQDVLQILEFVHSYRVIHRDIKPNNLIRRNKDSRLVLIDFGAVKEIGNPRIVSDKPTTKRTISIGTQGYMPTEQVRGKPRLNSDIYALGMIAIQALTGVDPIYLEEDEEGEVIWQNRAKVSNELAAILSQMVRYHFKDRYQCVTEVLQELRYLVNNRQVTQLNSQSPPTNSTIAPPSELKETKISFAKESSRKKAIAKLPHQATKVTFTSEFPVSEETLPPNLPAKKISLGRESSWEKANLESTQTKITIASKSESSASTVATSRKKKVSLIYLAILLKVLQNLDRISLGKKQLQVTAIANSSQTKTTIASKSELSASKVAANRDRKVSFLDLSTLISVFQNLDLNFFDLNFSPTFVTPPKSRLLMGAGVISLIVTAFAGYNYLDRRTAYLQAKQTLEQIEEALRVEKYPECIQQAEIFPQDYAKLNPQLETLLLECRQGEARGQIAEAKQLAEQSQLKNAIAIVANIPQDMNVYTEAQKLMSQWSEKIWQIASNKYQEGKLESAKAIAKAVPTASPIAKKVETTIQQWDREWNEDLTHLETARKKLEESRWQDAIVAAKKVSDNAYSQKQSEQIIQKAEAEIAALEALARKTSSRRGTSRTIYRSRPRTVYPTYSNSPTSKPLIREHNKKFNPAYNSKGDWVKERLGRE